MAKQLIYDYDPHADELSLTLGEPREAIGQELTDECFVQLDPVTREVVGFSVLGFGKRITHPDQFENRFAVPVELEGKMRLAF